MTASRLTSRAYDSKSMMRKTFLRGGKEGKPNTTIILRPRRNVKRRDCGKRHNL